MQKKLGVKKIFIVAQVLRKLFVGESLVCEREPSNAEDWYAVSVKQEGDIVGHLPRNISRICFLFLRHRGTIECPVTGARKYSHDL